MEIKSSWLTAPLLECIAKSICATPSSALSPLDRQEFHRTLWRKCGCPWDEIPRVESFLSRIGLLAGKNGGFHRSRLGDRIAKDLARDDYISLGLALIRAGCFHDQARILVELGGLQPNGALICEHRLVRTGAAQLLGVLSWWPSVTLLPRVTVPKVLVDEMNAVWALVPPDATTPTWALERQQIGLRAEMYTVQAEKAVTSDPTRIAWVARDSDTLGYDIEDRTREPSRCIEVKGSREEDPFFFLSDNEWKKAIELGARYEVQFWGKIDLSRDPATEYALLRTAGYPLVIADVVEQVQKGAWSANAVRWRIQKAEKPAP